jgi:hypothetical protein
MAIDFVCLFCGTKYRVPDTSAGRRARCKTCQRGMTVPGEASTSAAGGRPERDEFVPESAVVEDVPAGVVDHRGAAVVPAATGARATAPVWRQRLERIRPRSAPVWAAAVIVLALVVGLISDYVALFDMFVLGSAGILAILIALGWGLLVGFSIGSARLIALFATVPTIAVVVLVLRLTVKTANTSVKQHIPIGELLTILGYGLGIVFILLSFALGLATNPRAFKWPALLLLAGSVVLGTCWLPMAYRASSISRTPSSPSFATPTGGQSRRPPAMPGVGTRPLAMPGVGTRPPHVEGPAPRAAARKSTAEDSEPKPPPRFKAIPSTAPAEPSSPAPPAH